MSIEQLKSINQRKLEERARAHERHTRNKLIGPEASWLAGYLACVRDVREVIAKGGTPTHVANSLEEWAEEQP